MKHILKIAKTELRLLFYSPIAWFLLVAFLVQAAMIYLSTFKFYATQQEMGGWGLSSIYDLTKSIFSDTNGMLGRIIRRFYIFIPLISMSLLSREMETGTIKLLYSSPVRILQIVMGKYLSMVFFSLLMTCIVVIFMVMAILNIQNADTGIFFPATLGIFLVLCTYSAIGLFMSSLSRYQVVAAIATFLMIGALTYVGDIWQKYDFVRDLTYFLSIQGRAEQLLNGLFVSRDLVYFLVVIYIFLGLTYFKLKGGLKVKSFLIKAGRYALIIVSGLFFGYTCSRPALVFYFDATINQRNTLTPVVQNMLKDMDAPVEIITYSNALDNFLYVAMPENRNRLFAHWDRYIRFKPDLKFSFIFYYDQPVGKSLATLFPGKTLQEAAKQTVEGAGMKLSDFKTPAEIHQMIDLLPEQNRYVMQLKYKDKHTFLRVFDDPAVMPSEAEMAAAIKRLLVKNPPKILFLTGNQQRSIYKKGKSAHRTVFNHQSFRFSLVNQGFDVDTLSLNSHEIPSNVSAMVIADPKTVLSSTSLFKIQKYIEDGGNLLIAGEPGRQEILNPLLEKVGVKIEKGILVQPGKDHTPDVIRPAMGALTGTFNTQIGQLDELFKSGVRLEMPGATAISFTGNTSFKFKPLLFINHYESWLKKGRLVPDSAAITFNPKEGDVKAKFSVAAALTRNIKGREQRIIVTGDADFMDNEYATNPDVGNLPLSTGFINWLHYGQFPINAKRPDPTDNHLSLSFEALRIHHWFFLWLLPGLMIVTGTIILIRRKRK